MEKLYISNLRKSAKEMAVCLAPAAIAAAGYIIAMVGLFSSLVRPEIEKMNITIFAWGLLASFEIGMLFPLRGKKMRTETDYKWHRIVAITVLAELLACSAMDSLTGEEVLFIGCLHSASVIYLLFVVSIITIAAGYTHITRMLMAITAALILAGWISPLMTASWDGTRYSEEIFRAALLSELMIPFYVISILPPASMRRRRNDGR